MITLREKLVDMASYVHFLTAAEIFPKVKDAVEKKDKAQLMRLCRKANIPEAYRSTITSMILSASPQEKYPLPL